MHGKTLVGRSWPFWLALLILSACAQLAPVQEAPVQEEPIPATSPGPTAAQPEIPEGSFQNPVLRRDFPDPAVIHVDGVYYAYATNSAGRNVQVARSDDLVRWELLTDAMPALPAWARLGGSYVWAPEVIQIGDTFVLYYTARDKEADRQCIGAATSDKPEGKFRDALGQALVCQVEEGGSIDASPFRDGDRLYLYWKNDGNCCGRPTYIYVQEMAPNGLSLVGEPVRLIRNEDAWEGNVIEAPTMLQAGGDYLLLYSANNYGTDKYAVGYAVCETATGPCEKAPENPILSSLLVNPPVIGPGHQTILQVGDEMWILYHAWEVSSAGFKTDRRFVWLDRIIWEDGRLEVLGPTLDPQPAPQGE